MARVATQSIQAELDMKVDIIVSRHPGSIKWLGENGFEADHILASVNETDVVGKSIVGNIPMGLASKAERVGVIEFDRPPRGHEFTSHEMDEAGAHVSWYTIIPADAPDGFTTEGCVPYCPPSNA